MQIQCSAPGKLILIGEYAVLEGAPALVAAVDRLAIVTITDSNDSFFYISAKAIDVQKIPFTISENGLIIFKTNTEVQKRLSFFKTTFEFAWQYCKQSADINQPLNIEIDTEAFFSQSLQTKLGFGSSAAMTVALVEALFKYAGKETENEQTRNQLFRLALAAHKKAQNGLGSGIDIASSSYHGVITYRLGYNAQAEQITPVKQNKWPNVPMVVIFTGNSESTRKMVTGVNQLRDAHPDIFYDMIEQMAETAQVGCEAWSKKNLPQFLNAVERYYTHMCNLGEKSGMPIISPVHRQIAELVKQHGGVYKPSGAGSGDIGIAFAQEIDTLNKIVEALKPTPFKVVDITIYEQETIR